MWKIHNQGQRKQYTGGRGMLITYSTYKGLSFIHKMLLQISRKKKTEKWGKDINGVHMIILHMIVFYSHSKEQGKMPKKKVLYPISAGKLSSYSSLKSNLAQHSKLHSKIPFIGIYTRIFTSIVPNTFKKINVHQ